MVLQTMELGAFFLLFCVKNFSVSIVDARVICHQTSTVLMPAFEILSFCIVHVMLQLLQLCKKLFCGVLTWLLLQMAGFFSLLCDYVCEEKGGLDCCASQQNVWEFPQTLLLKVRWERAAKPCSYRKKYWNKRDGRWNWQSWGSDFSGAELFHTFLSRLVLKIWDS